MTHFDETSAECLVLTYKEGLLSAMGHDLMLRVTRWTLDVDEATPAVKARFEAGSIQVVSAVAGGVPKDGLLGEADKHKIEGTIRDEVLDARRFPEILFASTTVTRQGNVVRVTGDLTLHGRTRAVTLSARVEGDRTLAEVGLHQPDYGIKPYAAMLGALKIKPDVTIRIIVPRG